MQKLPTHLADEIFSNLFHYYFLYACEVDKNFLIAKMWGNNDFYGFENWRIGQDLSAENFLLGMPVNEPWVMRDVNVAPDNHADIYFSPNVLGKRYLIFVSTQSSIERRRENQQRGNQLTLLHEKNKHLIKELEESQRSLRGDNKNQTAFIAGMSHEFRTPLSSIIGYSQLISEQVGLSPDTLNYLGYIESASQHLLSLVENLLDQAQLDSENFELQRTNVSLNNLITEVTAIMASLASSKGLAFSATMSSNCVDYASIDNLRVRQILINLLGNAVKFTDEGAVTLTVDSNDSELIFVINDDGPGIPLDARDKIFNAFERVDNDVAKPGVGLGLNITKRLIDKMGGEINLFSVLGEGTQFTVRVPYTDASDDFVLERTQPIRIIKEEEFRPGYKLLLAEDNPDISNLLKIFLSRAGFSVDVVENGQLALDKLRMTEYDAVITDLQMPILGGKGLVKTLRKNGYTKPIIALTASEKKSEQDLMLEIGFTSFLTKPVQMPDLLSTLEFHIEKTSSV